MGRLLGIDYGERRIGTALSDPMRIIASPHDVVDARDRPHALKQLADLCQTQEVDEIIVGLPRNMDGSCGESAEKARQLADDLKECTGLPVRMWDERLSTVTAQQTLIEAGTRREKRKGLVDKLAAQVILQHYMDANP
jgi:putative Holliday junction resolvase